MFREGNNVLGTIAQRWNAKLELPEPVVEILTESTVFHRGFEILIGGGDNADVDLNLTVTAEPVEGLAVKHAQQFHLRLQLQFADFVEEKCPLVGEFEKARLRGVGAAERSLFVSKELALNKIFRKRGTVDVDPRPAAPARRLVYGAGDQFFSCTRFARDQNGFCMPGNPIDQTHEFVHHGAGKNELCAIDGSADDAGSNRSRRWLGLRSNDLGGHRLRTGHDHGYYRRWRRGGISQKRSGELNRETAP